MRSFGKLGVIAAAALCAVPAFADNLGFETSDLSGWTLHGNGAAVQGYADFAPVSGDFLAVIEAGQQDVYATLTISFDLLAGGTISGFAGFRSNDFIGYNDDAYLSINGINQLAWNVNTVGQDTSTGWQQFTFTADAAGTYILQLGVANRVDSAFSSGAVLDAVAVTGLAPPAVPEPASWAMMLGGFGLVGGAMRARTRKLRFA